MQGARLIAELRALGIGEATQRGEFPPRRNPFFYDNKAFSDWTNGREFNEKCWRSDVDRIREEGPTPDFIVLPDRVADVMSLEFSLSFVPFARGAAPLALVVQDGMTEVAVAAAMTRHDLEVAFVGGSLPWKLSTGAAWVRLAHSIGRRCHIGRVGTAPRVRWAREIGADSIDSCTPLWSRGNMRRFVNALSDPFQSGLWGAHPPPPRESWQKKRTT